MSYARYGIRLGLAIPSEKRATLAVALRRHRGVVAASVGAAGHGLHNSAALAVVLNSCRILQLYRRPFIPGGE